jgi:HNH endonuclease
MSPRLREFREISFQQACAIARVVLLRDMSMTNFDWHEAVKEACVKQGYKPPEGDMLTRACAAVERALMQTMGPRPVKEPGATPSEPKPETPQLTPAEWAAFGVTMRSVLARSTPHVTPANVRTIPTETLDVNEPAALDRFYLEAAVDRLGALKRFAEVAIVRGADWNPVEIRATSQVRNLHATACFACRTDARELHWHHVIQIQHGGSNYLRNRVALCAACHAEIHPWLPKVSRQVKGWSNFADAARDIAKWLKANGIAKPGDVA